MSDLPAPSPIAEYSDVTRVQFEAEIKPLGQPAILRGLVADWPVVAKANQGDEALAQYIEGFSLEKPIEMFILDAAKKGRFFYSDDLRGFNFDRRTAPLSKVLELLLRHRGDPDPQSFYAGAVNIPANLPDFTAQHQIPLLPPEEETLASIWLGNRTRTAPHWDLPQNIACVVAGQRRFTLFPASQISNLYIGPLDFTLAGQPCSLVDLHAPDLTRFPRFAEAAKHATVADLSPGDALYIPSLWIHHVESLTPFGMLVNYWWREGPKHLISPSFTLMHALLTLRDMPTAERAQWKHFFDYYIFNADDETLAHIPEPARGVFGEPTPALLSHLKKLLAAPLVR